MYSESCCVKKKLDNDHRSKKYLKIIKKNVVPLTARKLNTLR